MRLEPKLLSIITILVSKFPNKQIVTTGHSLGGALSILSAVDLTEHGFQNIKVVNFGCTRVGNDVFASYFGQLIQTCWRVVNERDLVAHYPAEWMNYHHVANEIWFENNVYNFTVCDNSGEDPNCSDSLDWYDPLDHVYYLGFDQTEGHWYGCGN